MERITFEQLPQIMVSILKKLDEIELKLQELKPQTKTDTEQLLTVEEAAGFLKIARPTIYSMISRRIIPYIKRSKRVYFSKNDLNEYLEAGRKKSNAEIQADVIKKYG